jgi:hypothetical protein
VYFSLKSIVVVTGDTANIVHFRSSHNWKSFHTTGVTQIVSKIVLEISWILFGL